jgi:hypothetical protein
LDRDRGYLSWLFAARSSEEAEKPGDAALKGVTASPSSTQPPPTPLSATNRPVSQIKTLISNLNQVNIHKGTVSQVYFALHETLHQFQHFQENNIFWY